jgi:hypothetical protein
MILLKVLLRKTTSVLIVQQIMCHCLIVFGWLKSSPVGYYRAIRKNKFKLDTVRYREGKK